MNHTPGPWIGTKAGPTMEGYCQGDAVASIEHNTLVAGCFSDVKGGPVVAEANARLIAAAPELLEALTRISRLSPPPNLSGVDHPAIAREILAIARAAIAKAEGQ